MLNVEQRKPMTNGRAAEAPPTEGISPIERHALLPDLIVKRLKEMIASGELRPGDALPSEAELASRFDVARPTIREAKKALTLIGLLDVRKGRGSFVHRDASRRIELTRTFEPSSLLEIFEGRRILEGGIVDLAAKRATSTDLHAMRLAMEAMEQAARDGDVTGVFRGDSDFHLALARAAHNTYLLRAMADTRVMLEDAVAKISQVPDNVHHAVSCHRAILAAIEVHNARQARQILLQHLDDSEKTIEATLV